MKKLFGGIDLTWKKLIIAAVIAGIYTAITAIIPELQYTSFHTIAVSFEVWILFGIIIIMNSKSNFDSAIKCFIFFLISQPLVYLIQVPFSDLGWRLLGYYKYWFIWTVCCIPMGYIGYNMKKGKWWGYLILFPMILLTAYSYYGYFSDFLFYRPKYILICIFCVAMMILYPLAIFEDNKIRMTGLTISIAAVIALTAVNLLYPPVYSTEIMSNSEEHPFDDTYQVSLSDERYGIVEIIYMESIEDYMIHGEFKLAGSTVLTIESPDGVKTEYDLSVKRDMYTMKRR